MVKNKEKYTVVSFGGRQYRASEGEELLVDKLPEGKLDYNVLLYRSGADVKVGKPFLEGVKVAFKILNEEEKGKKVDVFKYKSKSRYRRHIGFRPKYTRLLVEKIG